MPSFREFHKKFRSPKLFSITFFLIFCYLVVDVIRLLPKKTQSSEKVPEPIKIDLFTTSIASSLLFLNVWWLASKEGEEFILRGKWSFINLIAFLLYSAANMYYYIGYKLEYIPYMKITSLGLLSTTIPLMYLELLS